MKKLKKRRRKRRRRSLDPNVLGQSGVHLGDETEEKRFQNREIAREEWGEEGTALRGRRAGGVESKQRGGKKRKAAPQQQNAKNEGKATFSMPEPRDGIPKVEQAGRKKSHGIRRSGRRVCTEESPEAEKTRRTYA